MSDKPELCLKFASFVKSKRKEKKIPIRKVIEVSGLSRASIHITENGGSSPSIDSATRLLAGVGESWMSFLRYAGEAA